MNFWVTITSLLMFIVFSISDGNIVKSEYKYYKKVGWLKFHPIPADFQDAFQRCYFEGGVLASPISSKLQSAVVNATRNSLGSYPILTGIHATFSQGDFASIEGIPLSKINPDWAEGEPDNCENKESCIAMLDNGQLADVSCEETFPYLCYKTRAQGKVSEPCGTSDTDYSYYFETRTNRCYKFHLNGRTFDRAVMACAAQDAQLAVINSDLEAQALRELFAKYPDNVVKAPMTDQAYIGVSDWNERGQWLTTDGQTLKQAGYWQWAPNQPDNSTGRGIGEYCVGFVRGSGLLNDVGCWRILPFICEKDPVALNSSEESNEKK